jgi:hypothetical protein
MEQTDLDTCRTPAGLAFADHVITIDFGRPRPRTNIVRGSQGRVAMSALTGPGIGQQGLCDLTHPVDLWRQKQKWLSPEPDPFQESINQGICCNCYSQRGLQTK